jgi:putative flippase GtrA
MLSNPRLKRYILFGGAIYVLELLIIVGAEHIGESSVLAIGISFWSGLVISFILQKLFTFRDTRMHHRVLLPQVAAFSLLVLCNFGFTLLMAKLLAHSLPAVVIRTIALGITTIWNFYLYKSRIFVNRDTSDILF